jgi:hypothetical protein
MMPISEIVEYLVTLVACCRRDKYTPISNEEVQLPVALQIVVKFFLVSFTCFISTMSTNFASVRTLCHPDLFCADIDHFNLQIISLIGCFSVSTLSFIMPPLIHLRVVSLPQFKKMHPDSVSYAQVAIDIALAVSGTILAVVATTVTLLKLFNSPDF